MSWVSTGHRQQDAALKVLQPFQSHFVQLDACASVQLQDVALQSVLLQRPSAQMETEELMAMNHWAAPSPALSDFQGSG